MKSIFVSEIKYSVSDTDKPYIEVYNSDVIARPIFSDEYESGYVEKEIVYFDLYRKRYYNGVEEFQIGLSRKVKDILQLPLETINDLQEKLYKEYDKNRRLQYEIDRLKLKLEENVELKKENDDFKLSIYYKLYLFAKKCFNLFRKVKGV